MLAEAGLDESRRTGLERILAWQSLDDIGAGDLADEDVKKSAGSLRELFATLALYGVADWCRFDVGIVRGLAYYTGPVWEVHDCKGELRAIFGGGRYDRLIGEMGGKPMPSCGFGCGDAVLGILLQARGLTPPPERQADYFVVWNGEGESRGVLPVVCHLRDRGRSTQFDLKGGNMKRQMKKAADAGAQFVVMVGADFATTGRVVLRDMASGEQRDVALEDLGR
jgi:histidyl-tRNA synthetase